MRRLLAGIAVGALLVTASACGSSDGGGASDKNSSSGGTTTVKLGIIPIVDVAPSTWARRRASTRSAD